MAYRLKMLILILMLTVSLTACYKMPTEEDFCLIPSTNNPDFTRESTNNMPGMSY